MQDVVELFDQLFVGLIFQEIIVGVGVQCGEKMVVVIKNGGYDDVGVWGVVVQLFYQCYFVVVW